MQNRNTARALRGAVVGCLLVGCAAVPSAASAAATATPSNASVEQAARVNHKSEAQIRQILADSTARLHSSGRIYFVDPVPRARSQAASPENGPYPYTDTFLLHSRPGSSRVIYLDFNGETITGTAWNNNASFGTPASFYAEPFDTDGAPATFSNAEQDIVQSVWQRVSEDYAPFDVDVTTQDPGAAAIDRAGAGDLNFGTRALITDATEVQGTCSCGGVAYLGVFDDPTNHAFYQPALVFPDSLGNSAKNIAEASSHEVGHNFDLSHDGTASVGYYTGHGSWAPIMGVGYYEPIVQWSRGEYSGANNTQDDLSIIPANGAALLADDVGNTTGTALDKGTGPSITHSGIITTDADVDVFKITAGAGASTFTVTPAPNSPNLDASLKLLNSAGTVIASADPASGTVSTDVASGLDASISFTIPSTGTYYVSVEGVGAFNPLNTGYSGYASLGRYTLTGSFVSGLAPPPNNNFGAAQNVAGIAGTVTGTNVNATKETGEPNHAGFTGGKSIWYKWTAVTNGTVTIDTFGSAFDTLLGVYTGSAVNALTVKASNDDYGGLQSRVSFPVTAGTVYKIAVDGFGAASGAVTLHWTQVPVNDLFADATAIGGLSGSTTGTTNNAFIESGEPSHGSGSTRSVWYSYTAPHGGKLTVDTFGSGYDTLLAIYTGTAVNALTQLAQNDDAAGGAQSQVTTTVAAGTIVKIAVSGYSGASGAVTLHWALTYPANDDFAAATVITGTPGTVTGNTKAASKETGEPTHGFGSSKSIWYSWTAPATGTVTIDTFGSAYDTLLAAYSGTAVGALTLLGSNDDANGTLQSRLTIPVTAGLVYRFVVDGYNGASGAVTLHRTMP